MGLLHFSIFVFVFRETENWTYNPPTLNWPLCNHHSLTWKKCKKCSNNWRSMFKILKVFKVADFQSQQLVQESISKLNVCVRRCDGATVSSCYLVLLLARLKIDFMQTGGIQTRDLSEIQFDALPHEPLPDVSQLKVPGIKWFHFPWIFSINEKSECLYMCL